MEKTITELSCQKNNPKRCNLYLDGEFFCGIELITVMQNRLKVGDKIEEKKLKKIIDESEREKAMNKALQYVSRGMRSKAQIVKYLKDKKYPSFIVDSVIKRLAEVGYVDDSAFARSYINERKSQKGARLLRFELKVKGVDEKVIDEALSELSFDGAVELARKFFKNSDFSYENTVKCYRRLLSKGFDYDEAKEAVEIVKRESEDEDYQD